MSTGPTCRFISNDSCYACGIETPLSQEICRGCCRTAHGPGINEVTVLYAIDTLQKNEDEVPGYLHDYLKNPDIHSGPGTTLSNLLSWFVTKPPNCACGDRAELMNLWGKEGCKKNLSTIYGWLRESALDNNIKYSEFVIAPLVKLAIGITRETKTTRTNRQ